jgi:hypothetical protein
VQEESQGTEGYYVRERRERGQGKTNRVFVGTLTFILSKCEAPGGY